MEISADLGDFSAFKDGKICRDYYGNQVKLSEVSCIYGRSTLFKNTQILITHLLLKGVNRDTINGEYFELMNAGKF